MKRGGKYIHLEPWIVKKEAVINIQNNDDKSENKNVRDFDYVAEEITSDAVIISSDGVSKQSEDCTASISS